MDLDLKDCICAQKLCIRLLQHNKNSAVITLQCRLEQSKYEQIQNLSKYEKSQDTIERDPFEAAGLPDGLWV